MQGMYSKYGAKSAQLFQFDVWSRLLPRYLRGSQLYLPPIAHLVLQDYLQLSFRESMEYSNGSLWECPNPLASCGRALTPRSHHQLGDKRERVECQKCGFIAKVPGASPLGSRPSISTIINRGPVFDAEVLKAVADGTRVNQIRTKAGMSYWTFERILVELGYKCTTRKKPGLQRALGSQRFIQTRDRFRSVFADFRRLHPEATRTEIASALGSRYLWMTHNDREWYEAHAPRPLGSSTNLPWLRKKV